MDYSKEFKKYATQHRGISSMYYDAIVSSMTPYIVEERQILAACSIQKLQIYTLLSTPLETRKTSFPECLPQKEHTSVDELIIFEC